MGPWTSLQLVWAEGWSPAPSLYRAMWLPIAVPAISLAGTSHQQLQPWGDIQATAIGTTASTIAPSHLGDEMPENYPELPEQKHLALLLASPNSEQTLLSWALAAHFREAFNMTEIQNQYSQFSGFCFLFPLLSWSFISTPWDSYSYFFFPICMGTAESQPEPLIDHQRQALSQPQGHRWMQFHLSDRKAPDSTPPRHHLRADSQGVRISIWRLLLLEPFCEPGTWVSSLFHYSFVMW